MDGPTAAPANPGAADVAALTPLVTALLRCAAPPAELLTASGGPLPYSAQDVLVRLLRSAPRVPDAAYLQRLPDALAAQLEAVARGGKDNGDDDDDELCVHDGLYELAQAARDGGALGGGCSGGGHVSYWPHPALAAALGGGDARADADACALPPPLVCVWRSATFSDVSTGVWPAALTLAQAVGTAAYPAASGVPPGDAAASAALHPRWRALWAGSRVVELGAGTGLAGLALAALSVQRLLQERGMPPDSTGGLHLTSLCLTDGEAKSVALLARNAADNGFGGGTGGGCGGDDAPAALPACRVTAAQLDWTDCRADAPVAHPLAWPAHDAVIATDVVYDPAAVGPLVGTLAALLRPPGAALAAGAPGAGVTTAPPPPSLEAALDALLTPLPSSGPAAGASAAAPLRRPFALLANTRRNASTYALLEASLTAACTPASGLAWADVTEPLLGAHGLSQGRPVLDLRLPTPLMPAADAAAAGNPSAAVTDSLLLRNGASGAGVGGGGPTAGAEVRLVLVW